MNGDDTPRGDAAEAVLTDASQPAGRHLMRLVFSQDTPAQRPCRRPRPQRGRRSRCPFCGPMGWRGCPGTVAKGSIGDGAEMPPI